MKQILQHLKTGELLLEDVPAPLVKSGHILVQTNCSLISAGTERMVVDFGRANYLQKALQKPDKVKQVIQKAKTDGIMATIDAVQSRLDQPIPLGYSNVGKVIAVGDNVEGYKVGDRVVSNGRHAEVVCVPVNLTAKIPENVTDEQASFTVLSSIALQGVRLTQPTIGEYICVMGLGLIGLIAVQILKANGVQVIGFDFDSNRVAIAQKFGIEAHDLSKGIDPIKSTEAFTKGQGIDAVLITAATKSNDVIHQAATMCRQRGRVILTGVVGLDIDRNDFYEKELTFQVSCSYGPGRYDSAYEDNGQDYPVGFVRWTEQRNFQAVLQLLEQKSININPLLSKRIELSKAKEAYDNLNDATKIGILLEYPQDSAENKVSNNVVTLRTEDKPVTAEKQAVLGIIGAGGFTQARILPALAKTNVRLKWICSASGVSSAHAAKKFKAENNTSDYKHILDDKDVNCVMITTQHNSHAHFVKAALAAGKHVFVEKPLCLNREEMKEIKEIYEASCAKYNKQLIAMVGFNRRFSPLTEHITNELKSRQNPASFVYTVNAGHIPADHWTQDLKAGGGRIIGEVCHFIDYIKYLAKSEIIETHTLSQNMGERPSMHDNVSIGLKFADGSIGQVNYFACGHKDYAKERCDIFFDGRVITLDNYKKVTGFGTKIFSKKKIMRQDKGHNKEVSLFIDAVANGGDAPISFTEIENVMNATFTAFEQASDTPREKPLTESNLVKKLKKSA